MRGEQLRTELLRLFAAELEQRTARVERYLGELGATPPSERRDALLEALALEAHNLVGTARTLDLDDAVGVGTGLETLAERIRRGEVRVTADVVETVTGTLRSLAPPVETPAER